MSYVMSRSLGMAVCPKCGREGRISIAVYDIWGKLACSVYVKHYDGKSKITRTCSIGRVKVSDIKLLDKIGDILCLVNTARMTGYSSIEVSDSVVKIDYKGFTIVLKVEDGNLIDVNIEYGRIPEHLKPLASHIANIITTCYKKQ
ncbi:MAG: hypothetical protein QXH21_09200 [Ignisphaera sp.]